MNQVKYTGPRARTEINLTPQGKQITELLTDIKNRLD